MTKILDLENVSDIKVANIFNQMTYEERALMLKKLLGPLLDETILTDQEAAYYFIYTTRGRTLKKICRVFKLTEARIHQVISAAERKIKKHRKNE